MVTAIIVSVIGGLLIGLLLGRMTNRTLSKQKKLQTELKNTQQNLHECETYVAEHFKKSSVLLNNMVQEYRDLYSHLAKSSTFKDENPLLENPFSSRIVDGVKSEDPDLSPTLSAEPMKAEESNEASLEVNSAATSEEKELLTTQQNSIAESEENPDHQLNKELMPKDYSLGSSGLLRPENK